MAYGALRGSDVSQKGPGREEQRRRSPEKLEHCLHRELLPGMKGCWEENSPLSSFPGGFSSCLPNLYQLGLSSCT